MYENGKRHRGGRVIVEGDHPGSTYVIQELRAKVTRFVTATIQRASGRNALIGTMALQRLGRANQARPRDS